MTYAVLSDLVAASSIGEIRQVADRDGDGEPDGTVITAALVAADQLIDGYVGTRYNLPMAEVPPIVTTWAVAIARYYLHSDGPPDYVEKGFQTTVAALKDVAKGVMALPLASGASASPGSGGSVLAAHPDTVFSADRLRGW